MREKGDRGHYGWIAGVVLALLAQMTFSRHLMDGFAYADFFLLFVVYHAATKFEKGGLVAGAVAGFLQDCFSGGPLGLCGISLTVIGYGFGVLSRRFLLARPLFYPLAVALASLAHDLIVYLLMELSLRISVDLQPHQLLYGILWNALCGSFLLVMIQKVRQRRRRVAYP